MPFPPSIEQSRHTQAPDFAGDSIPTEPNAWSAYDVWHKRIRRLPVYFARVPAARPIKRQRALHTRDLDSIRAGNVR
jgi:hypothetical protein